MISILLTTTTTVSFIRVLGIKNMDKTSRFLYQFFFQSLVSVSAIFTCNFGMVLKNRKEFDNKKFALNMFPFD